MTWSYVKGGAMIMALVRMDAGDGAQHGYKYYEKFTSIDDGRTWTDHGPIQGLGCALPRLLILGN